MQLFSTYIKSNSHSFSRAARYIFWTDRPVSTASDWTGHVMNSANHRTKCRSETRIVCYQGNNDLTLNTCFCCKVAT